jgi:hypothetical protein
VAINNRDAITIIAKNNLFFILITSLVVKLSIFTKSVKNEFNQAGVHVIKLLEIIKDKNNEIFFILPPRQDIHSAGVNPTKSGRCLLTPGRMADGAAE